MVFKRPKGDRKSTRLNSSYVSISYAVFCLKKKTSERSQSPENLCQPGTANRLGARAAGRRCNGQMRTSAPRDKFDSLHALSSEQQTKAGPGSSLLVTLTVMSLRCVLSGGRETTSVNSRTTRRSAD